MNLRSAAMAALLAAAFCAGHAMAGTLSLDGTFRQGGLVTGRTDPGTQITLDGTPVRVGPAGRFVFGFGRDAAPKAVLTAVFPDGTRQARTLEVAQRTYRIQRIDGLPRRMVTPSEKQLKRIRAEAKKINAARGGFTMAPYFEQGFIWPVKGRISGVYGSQRILNGEPRRPHLGIDIAAPTGTPVVAAAGGTVTLAEKDLYFTGGTIVIDHGFGLSTVYSHLSAVSVKTGQGVKQGELIGKIGSTGRSTGAHLDWRINWFQERLDPAFLVGPKPE